MKIWYIFNPIFTQMTDWSYRRYKKSKYSHITNHVEFRWIIDRKYFFIEALGHAIKLQHLIFANTSRLHQLFKCLRCINDIVHNAQLEFRLLYIKDVDKNTTVDPKYIEYATQSSTFLAFVKWNVPQQNLWLTNIVFFKYCNNDKS